MIVAASKCNITQYALTKLNELYYGILCDKTVNQNIIVNYLEYLKCDGISPIICDPSDCATPPVVVFNCAFKVVNLSYTPEEVDQNLYMFYIANVAGGTPPFTYNWQFEQDDFAVTEGGINSPELRLVLKAGKIFSNLVSEVKVTITDANGCVSERRCYLVNGVMQCSVNYVPCPNPSTLTLSSIVTTCPAPSSLILSKI